MDIRVGDIFTLKETQKDFRVIHVADKFTLAPMSVHLVSVEDEKEAIKFFGPLTRFLRLFTLKERNEIEIKVGSIWQRKATNVLYEIIKNQGKMIYFRLLGLETSTIQEREEPVFLSNYRQLNIKESKE